VQSPDNNSSCRSPIRRIESASKVLVLLSLLASSVAAACTMISPALPPELADASFAKKQRYRWQEEFQHSDAVLEILVLSVEDLDRSEWPLTRTRVQVLRTWKSDGKPLDIIESGRGGGDCGVGFAVGYRYIVFAGRVTSFWSFLPWAIEPLAAGVYDATYLGRGRTGKSADSSEDVDALVGLLNSLGKQNKSLPNKIMEPTR
jgi:hypothetical protein